ncbi:pyruvate kinase [Rhodococcus wratislaviensis IFP 2016]|nr:pyruvate kinase [Rhodococcus wratislaviensis IFP 2016]
MLSGETSVGAYPLETVATMARILTAVEHESTPRCRCWNSPRYPG